MSREFDQSRSLLELVETAELTQGGGRGEVDLGTTITARINQLDPQELKADVITCLQTNTSMAQKVLAYAQQAIGNQAFNQLINEIEVDTPGLPGLQGVNTKALVAAMANPHFDFIGNPDMAWRQASEASIDPALTSQFKRTTGIDLSNVQISENPQLEKEGVRGVAIEGRAIEVAPGMRGDAALVLHEMAHIGQQRGGSPGHDAVITTRDAAETEADQIAAATQAGERKQASRVEDFGRLYQDENTASSVQDRFAPTGPDGRREYQVIHSLRELLAEDQAQEIEAMVTSGSASDVEVVARMLELSRGKMIHRSGDDASAFDLPSSANSPTRSTWVIKVRDDKGACP